MKNKVILITGGTTGIGLATAQLLLSEGAKVIVTGRNPATLDAAKKALPNAIVIQSDSEDLASVQSLGAAVKEHTDHLDGAFLNAGVITQTPFESVTAQEYDNQFNVNVRGLYFQLQSVLPLLKNPSSVVFTSSIASSMAFPGASIYSATKAAVNSFGRVLAIELAPRGVRVNVLSPGPIDTPIIGKTGLDAETQKSMVAAMIEKSVLKRLGTPNECAKAVRFLLSEDSSNIVGIELAIDGGFRLA
ncbi:short-chain dehydrogenase [Pseudomonas brenneri]|nr:SDR family oxidoreductase [Pseudomonas brenneri]GGL49261.1 short-chain dehydrogenase [Pseudomonas brenneri]SDU96145.1 NAD(P)-dependent dehydrogenase, short-chain alcohol dehydrogenase family [Pseudomonas brenneri]